MHSNKMQSPANSILSVPSVNGHPVRGERRDLRVAMAGDWVNSDFTTFPVNPLLRRGRGTPTHTRTPRRLHFPEH